MVVVHVYLLGEILIKKHGGMAGG